jgi:hypothetical protein
MFTTLPLIFPTMTHVDFMVNRAASYYLDELASVAEHVSIKDSTLTRDSTTVDSSVNRTLKTGHPRKTLSDCLGKNPSVSTTNAAQVTMGGHVVGSIVHGDDSFHFQVMNTNVRHRISRLSHVDPGIDMVDHGVSSGVAGSNMRVIFCHPTWSVDIEGYDQHCTTGIPLITCANVVQTQCGKVVAIYHNYAFTGKGRSIHSVPQLEANKHFVDDCSLCVRAMQ